MTCNAGMRKNVTRSEPTIDPMRPMAKVITPHPAMPALESRMKNIVESTWARRWSAWLWMEGQNGATAMPVMNSIPHIAQRLLRNGRKLVSTIPAMAERITRRQS
jgi:hypothetical protein